MFHGDEIVVVSEGLQIAPEALAPLDIKDGSRCWGVWQDDSRPQPGAARPPHLHISAIHPSSWPIAVRLEIVLADKKGAVARAAKVFQDQDVSISFATATPTGFYHSTWNVICEQQKLRESMERDRNDVHNARQTAKRIAKKPGIISWEELEFAGGNRLTKLKNDVGRVPHSAFIDARDASKKLRLKIGIEAAKFIRRMKYELMKAHAVTGNNFLHGKFLDEKNLFWDFRDENENVQIELRSELESFEKVMGTENDRLWDHPGKYENPLVTGDAMPWLAQAWLFGRNVDDPISMRYIASQRLLRVEPSHEFDILVRSLDVPKKAVAAFNPDERFVRVEFRPPSERRVWINVKYRTDAAPGTKNFEHSPSKLLHSLCSPLADEELGVNLVRVSNAITDRDKTAESGMIHFSGVVNVELEGEEQKKTFLNKVKSTLEHVSISDPIRGNTTVLGAYDLTVGWDSVDPLFISTRLEFLTKRPDLKMKIEETARQLGFDPVIVENPKTNPIPEAVQKAIRGAKAVLQIIPLLCHPTGKFESVKEAKLDWLHFESGFAACRNIPIAMCVDTVDGATLDEWVKRLAPRAGWALRTFNQSDGEDKIVADIRKAIEWLR